MFKIKDQGTQLTVITLLEKQSKFLRKNMKCRGKPDTTWTIPRSITLSPLHFMLFRGKSITFGTVYSPQGINLLLEMIHCLHCQMYIYCTFTVQILQYLNVYTVQVPNLFQLTFRA